MNFHTPENEEEEGEKEGPAPDLADGAFFRFEFFDSIVLSSMLNSERPYERVPKMDGRKSF